MAEPNATTAVVTVIDDGQGTINVLLEPAIDWKMVEGGGYKRYIIGTGQHTWARPFAAAVLAGLAEMVLIADATEGGGE